MHLFVSNQISVHHRLLYESLEVQLLSRGIFISLNPFSSLPHPLFIQTQLLLSPKKRCMPNMSRNCFFLWLCSLSILYATASLCLCFFFCFPIHSYEVLQSRRGMNPQLVHGISQRTGSNKKTQSPQMFHLEMKTAASEWCEHRHCIQQIGITRNAVVHPRPVRGEGERWAMAIVQVQNEWNVSVL